MFRQLRTVFVLVVVTGCAAWGDLSPRQQSQDLMTRYRIVQEVALLFVTSSFATDNPDIKKAVQVAEAGASATVLAYNDQVKGCTVTIDNEPIVSDTCNPARAAVLLPVALDGLQMLAKALERHGIATAE